MKFESKTFIDRNLKFLRHSSVSQYSQKTIQNKLYRNAN